MTTPFAHSVPRLKRLLPRLRGKPMGVLGDLMLDRYLWGTASRLSPEAAVPVVDFVGQNECLGGGGNVAANLAATLVRFALYRNWVFGSPRGGGAPPETSPPAAALPELALPETTPVDVINETSWSTR